MISGTLPGLRICTTWIVWLRLPRTEWWDTIPWFLTILLFQTQLRPIIPHCSIIWLMDKWILWDGTWVLWSIEMFIEIFTTFTIKISIISWTTIKMMMMIWEIWTIKRPKELNILIVLIIISILMVLMKVILCLLLKNCLFSFIKVKVERDIWSKLIKKTFLINKRKK